MTGWIVLGGVVLALGLLSLLRLGAEVSYDGEGLRVRLRLGQIRVTLYPRRNRRPKRQKPKKNKPQKKKTKGKAPPKKTGRSDAPGKSQGKGGKPAPGAGKPSAAGKASPAGKAPDSGKASAPPEAGKPGSAQEKGEKGGLPAPLMDLISLALDAAGTVFARLQVDTLEVRYTIAGKEDPAWAAIQYGLICAGTGGLVPVLENTFYGIRRREIQARVDFDSAASLIWLKLALSIRLGQLLSAACRIGWAIFQLYRQQELDSSEIKAGG